ncbi:NAD(P)/FAD-dependent oxidoreductase [Nocardioides sp.]|uniref:flavin-containing monooxygenase n=1 Tax=Nocardioides sp. TaxID=35761 RepID=UPI002735F6B5|nr:NAD(P)/FAD-dependent oxidoreductase [Nocardioides sp.]MDP3891012.1 NAD(P)/FAD-dependent oxidoreductase [Nocardioides sp.]
MNAPTSLPSRVRHLIVGAGFAGLGTAIKLDEAGESDFLVIEKGSDVGGTWRDNTYPGAACDVPSQLYSFSFAPNDWSRSFSPQPEIHAYLQRVARESGTLDRFVFGTLLEDAAWDETEQAWRVRTSRGEVLATNLITGSGGLSEPKLPEIDGIEDFTGELFHSARWNHDVDLTGKRVAVIGTGASAIQIVPEIAKVAGHLDVYQRTAPWVIPRHDRSYSRLERLALQHVPGLRKAYRTGIYWGRESYVPAFTRQPRLTAPAAKMGLANIRKGISDPALRERVTPNFQIGCKRILISNTWYPTLDADHVDLVTDRITKVAGNTIVTADGAEREVDVLIVATGFYTTDQPIGHHIRGRGGRTLADTWADAGMAAYKGTTIHGFPNLFQIVGPNTGLGHSSMVFIIESQIAYITDALRTQRINQYAAMEPKLTVQQEWNTDLQRRMERTVWSSGGCASWYLDDHGRNTTLWPRSTFTFRKLLSEFDVSSYDVEAPAAHREELSA